MARKKKEIDAEQIRRDAAMLSGTQWFKMSGRGPFHDQASDWVRTGKALCGADIAHPALTVVSPMPTMQKLCEKCLAILRKGTAARGSMRETSRDRPISLTYGQLPPFAKFERDIRRPDPDRDGDAYWPLGTLYPMELVGSHEIELAEGYGLDSFEAERRRTGRNSGVSGFNGDEGAIYGFLEYLADCNNDGDDEAGDLASSIMTTLGYEWI